MLWPACTNPGYIKSVLAHAEKSLQSHGRILDTQPLATDSMISLIALTAATLLLLSLAGTSAQGDSSCRACNCQFNNIQVLDRMMESKINKSLANDPGEIS